MRVQGFLLLVLLLGVFQVTLCNPVTHDDAVEDAIAEAENETHTVQEDSPALETEPEIEDHPTIIEDEEEAHVLNGEPIEHPPLLDPNYDDPEAPEEEPNPENDDETAIPETTPEDEILSLPHLPDPEYNADGDILWFPRIIGGSRAQLGEFPSKVSIQTRGGSHFCGGNLITSKHILTAAHCVVTEDGHLLNPASIEIMGGDISIDRNPGTNRVHRIVSHIFVHNGYDPHTMSNDITVLRVSIAFYVIAGILEPEPLALEVPVVGTTCNLAGWGATSEGSNNASPNLMRVNLEIVDTERCNKSYQGMVGEHMFCAGTMSGGRDACQGDSGGGLMCNGVITGVVSFGFGCGRPRFPGVYMDVSAYGEFIEGAINFEGTHEDIPQPEFLPGSAKGIHKLSVVAFVVAVVMRYLL